MFNRFLGCLYYCLQTGQTYAKAQAFPGGSANCRLTRYVPGMSRLHALTSYAPLQAGSLELIEIARSDNPVCRVTTA